MKKRLFATVLVICCILMSSVSAFAMPTVAEFEPVEGTPYGIPIYDSIDEVDLGKIFDGHGLKRMLNLPNIDNIEVSSYIDHRSSSNSYIWTWDSCHYKDGDNYVTHSVDTSIQGAESRERLFLYDKNDPSWYYKKASGYTKSTIDVAFVDNMLERPYLPFYTPDYNLVIKDRSVVDGFYVFHFDMLPLDDTGTQEYKDCTVTIDPNTSLILKAEYHHFLYNGGICTYEEIVSTDVLFNVDKQPDYSIKQ